MTILVISCKKSQFRQTNIKCQKQHKKMSRETVLIDMMTLLFLYSDFEKLGNSHKIIYFFKIGRQETYANLTKKEKKCKTILDAELTSSGCKLRRHWSQHCFKVCLIMGPSGHCRVLLCTAISDFYSWDWVLSKSGLTHSNRTTGGWETARKSSVH